MVVTSAVVMFTTVYVMSPAIVESKTFLQIEKYGRMLIEYVETECDAFCPLNIPRPQNSPPSTSQPAAEGTVVNYINADQCITPTSFEF